MKIVTLWASLALICLGVLTTLQYSSLDLEQGQQVPLKSGDDSQAVPTDNSDLIYTEESIDDFLQGDPQKITNFFENLRSHRENPDDFKIEHNKTLLQKISRLADVDLMKKCLSLGANINAQDSNGWTALHNAIVSQSLQAVVYAIQAGADITIHDQRGRSIIEFCQEYSSNPDIERYINAVYTEEIPEFKASFMPLKNIRELQEEQTQKSQQDALRNAEQAAEAKAGAQAMRRFRQQQKNPENY